MLLQADGFHGGHVTTRWDPSSTGTRGTTSPRFAGGAYTTNGTVRQTFTAVAEVFVTAAFYLPSAAAQLFAFYGDAGATQHLTVMRNSSGKIEVRRGTSSGTVIATGTTTVPATTWVQIEARATIDDTIGVVQVRLYGGATNEISFTGDTKNAGTATSIDRVYITATSTGKVTDAAIANTSGTHNTSWFGPMTINTLVPNGTGSSSDGTMGPSSAAAHYTFVDDLPPTFSDVVKVSSGDDETYFFTNTTSGAAIKAAVITIGTYGNAAASLKRLLRTGGTDYLGPTISVPSVADVVWSEILETDPATTALWDPVDVDGIELGFRGLSGLTNVTGIFLELLYDPSANLVTVTGGGTISVDAGNTVAVDGGGTIDALLAGMTALVEVTGNGTIATAVLTDGYPAPTPTDPTLTLPDPDVEPVIQEVLVTYPAPTLVQGVPVGWEPS